MREFLHSDLAYWLKCEWLSKDEAALLMFGFAPAEGYDSADEHVDIPVKAILRMFPQESVRSTLRLIERRFRDEAIAPAELLNWAISEGLPIHADLKEAFELTKKEPKKGNAGAKGASTKKSQSNELDGRGAHWNDLRLAALEAAIQIMSDAELNKSVRNKSGKLIVDKLTALIDDQRHRWPLLKNQPAGTSFNNMRTVVRNALRIGKENQHLYAQR